MFLCGDDAIPPINPFRLAFWQRCCVTVQKNCSFHRKEPACPLSAHGIRGTLSTLRFSVGDVSQLQQKQACPNTGCSPLRGKLIGLFTASHHVKAKCVSMCFKGCRATSCYSPPVLWDLELTRFVGVTCMMCHHRLGHCLKPQWGFWSCQFVVF